MADTQKPFDIKKRCYLDIFFQLTATGAGFLQA
jgi:hypothetical protein